FGVAGFGNSTADRHSATAGAAGCAFRAADGSAADSAAATNAAGTRTTGSDAAASTARSLDRPFEHSVRLEPDLRGPPEGGHYDCLVTFAPSALSRSTS